MYRWHAPIQSSRCQISLPTSSHYRRLSASWMQFAVKRSFRLLYTMALPSARCSRNLDHHWTNQFSIAARAILCVSVPTAHLSLFWRCCWFKTTALTVTGRFALIPASRRRFLTVWSEILRTPGIVDAVHVAQGACLPDCWKLKRPQASSFCIPRIIIHIRSFYR
jgi:hypothetical protein